MHCYSKEALFYTRLAPRCAAKVPKCYYCSVSPDERATTLLLEDIVGGVPGDTHTSLTPEQAKSAVTELGKLHGSFLDAGSVLEGVQTAFEHASSFKGPVAASAFISAWGDMLEAADTRLIPLFEKIAASNDDWLAKLGTGPISLIHGDYKGTNLLFQGDQATILDFQTIFKGVSCVIGSFGSWVRLRVTFAVGVRWEHRPRGRFLLPCGWELGPPRSPGSPVRTGIQLHRCLHQCCDG
jgi:hypothetical protein